MRCHDDFFHNFPNTSPFKFYAITTTDLQLRYFQMISEDCFQTQEERKLRLQQRMFPLYKNQSKRFFSDIKSLWQVFPLNLGSTHKNHCLKTKTQLLAMLKIENYIVGTKTNVKISNLCFHNYCPLVSLCLLLLLLLSFLSM